MEISLQSLVEFVLSPPGILCLAYALIRFGYWLFVGRKQNKDIRQTLSDIVQVTLPVLYAVSKKEDQNNETICSTQEQGSQDLQTHSDHNEESQCGPDNLKRWY